MAPFRRRKFMDTMGGVYATVRFASHSGHKPAETPNGKKMTTSHAPLRSTAAATVLLALFLGSAGRAGAALISYQATLTGPGEFPPNASPGVGFTEVDYNSTAHTLRVQASFTGLLGTTPGSHIHAATALPGVGTAGVATQTPTFSGFPLGVTAGTFDQTLDLTSATAYNPAYVTANGGTAASAEAALGASLASGTSYLNIHTSVVPNGEIRGFLVATPEPGSLALLAPAAYGLLRRGRRREG